MRKIFGILLLVAVSCHPPQGKLYDFAEGGSMASAIVIAEDHENKGVEAEYTWIKKHYRAYRVVGQHIATAPHGKRVYDVLTIMLPDGARRDIYFDITRFYGKL